MGEAQQRNRKAQQKMLEVSNRKWNVAITAFKRFAIKVLNRYAVAGEDSGMRGAWRKMKTRFRQAANSSLRRVVKEFREWNTATVEMTEKYFRTEAAVRLEEGRGERERRKWQDKIKELRAEAQLEGRKATTKQESKLHCKREGRSIAPAVLRKRKTKKKKKIGRNKQEKKQEKKKKKLMQCDDAIHSSIKCF